MKMNESPKIKSALRHNILEVPKATYKASGIIVNGRRIKSFIFSTDIAIIRNCDADAVFAVYPFIPQLVKIIRDEFPNVPIIASGGGTDNTISATIEAGANAITYTPPSTKDLFSSMMVKYREE